MGTQDWQKVFCTWKFPESPTLTLRYCVPTRPETHRQPHTAGPCVAPSDKPYGLEPMEKVMRGNCEDLCTNDVRASLPIYQKTHPKRFRSSFKEPFIHSSHLRWVYRKMRSNCWPARIPEASQHGSLRRPVWVRACVCVWTHELSHSSVGMAVGSSTYSLVNVAVYRVNTHINKWGICHVERKQSFKPVRMLY